MPSSSSGTTQGQHLIDDLKHIQTFLQTQKRSLKKNAFNKMLDNQAKAWGARISEAKIKPSEAADMGELLASGPWREDQQEALSVALAESVGGTGSTPHKPCNALPPT